MAWTEQQSRESFNAWWEMESEDEMPDEWDRIRYPELTDDENEEIRRARRAGFASFFPAFPSAEAQSRNTLAAARQFLLLGRHLGERKDAK